MAGINYLFPPDQIMNLPTWRFMLHFVVSDKYSEERRKLAVANLKQAEWKIVTFPLDLNKLGLNDRGDALLVPYEVTEERRKMPNSLADLESDVWKIIGNVMEQDFVETIYYDALDWEE